MANVVLSLWLMLLDEHPDRVGGGDMTRALALIVFFISAFATISVEAQNLDKASEEALAKTQQLLTSPEERNASIEKDKDAKAADDRLRVIPGMNDADRQKTYEITSQIMGALVQQTGGDVTKQKTIVDQASRDPQAFFNGLSPDQRKAIDDLSQKAESQMAPSRH